MTITQEKITYKRAKRPVLSQQVVTRLQWTDKTSWQTPNLNNKKGPPLNVSKKINAQTNAHIKHLVLVQGLCFFAWVKLLGVIRFLHPFAMARNPHGRHGTTEFFHADTVGNGNIRKDCCFMYNQSSTTFKMDSALWFIICSKAKRSRCYPPTQAALKSKVR